VPASQVQERKERVQPTSGRDINLLLRRKDLPNKTWHKELQLTDPGHLKPEHRSTDDLYTGDDGLHIKHRAGSSMKRRRSS